MEKLGDLIAMPQRSGREPSPANTPALREPQPGMPAIALPTRREEICRAWGIPRMFWWLDQKPWRAGILFGPAGTGKTHEAVRRLLGAPGRGYFITAAKLLHEAKRSFDEDTISPIEKVMTRPFLVLDDLGAERPTEWAIEQIGLVVDERWSNERATLITSNADLESLERVFGDRIVSRIAAFGPVEKFSGRDRRIEP